jgi:hypothetical protein
MSPAAQRTDEGPSTTDQGLRGIDQIHEAPARFRRQACELATERTENGWRRDEMLRAGEQDSQQSLSRPLS